MKTSGRDAAIFRIEGHAIVSVEGAIADASGLIPPCLRNEADWVAFQRALDDSALTILGRASHEAAPNPGRLRLVLTRAANGLERRDALTWAVDPSLHRIEQAMAAIAPGGGRVAVVGGREVFDLFLARGYDAFYLSVAGRCRVPGGIPVFTGVDSAEAAMARLIESGLELAGKRLLDAGEEVVLHHFVR